ncbi:glycosyltransferase [Ekhidna sp.]|uniref:glycosyltransferase family 2 protein n=1 Tax=Ekhidna sp. TaxID=2608089 RepID=UPI003B503BFB
MEAEKKYSCTIAICTHNRPKGLSVSIRAVAKLHFPVDLDILLLVVDNGSLLESKQVFDSEVKKLEIPSEYIKESNKGISHARNAALSYANERHQNYLAFFDDDDYPDPNWLHSLWVCMKKYNSHVSAGRMVFKWPSDCDLDDEVKRIYALAAGKTKTGTLLKRCGSGNVLIDLGFVTENKLTFHPKFNLTGGGDAHFFELLSIQGGKIVHCDEAIVYSDVDVARTNEEYIFNRRYKVGYNSFNKDALLYGKHSAIRISILRCLSIWMDCGVRFFNRNPKNRAWIKRQLSEAKGRVHSIMGRPFEYYNETDGK